MKVGNATAKSSAERQAKFRKGQKKLGRTGRVYFLTDEEKKAVDSFLAELRQSG